MKYAQVRLTSSIFGLSSCSLLCLTWSCCSFSDITGSILGMLWFRRVVSCEDECKIIMQNVHKEYLHRLFYGVNSMIHQSALTSGCTSSKPCIRLFSLHKTLIFRSGPGVRLIILSSGSYCSVLALSIYYRERLKMQPRYKARKQ